MARSWQMSTARVLVARNSRIMNGWPTPATIGRCVGVIGILLIEARVMKCAKRILERVSVLFQWSLLGATGFAHCLYTCC